MTEIRRWTKVANGCDKIGKGSIVGNAYNKKASMIYFSPKLHNRIRALAIKNVVSFSEQVRTILENHIDEWDK